jgi:carboxyl-terminal processing protease
LKFLKIAGLVGVVALAFGIGFSWRDLRNGELPSKRTVEKLLGTPEKRESPTQVFKTNFNLILKDYYKPVDPKELKYSGMEGLLAALGDPHTIFLEPRTAEEFSKETKGENEFVGVGARLGRDPLGAKIMIVFDGGPAQRAGVRSGDVIVSVNGEPTGGVPLDDVVKKIRGKEGTTVTLELLRAGLSNTLKIPIKRGTINPPTADGMVIEGTRVGLITVQQFAQPTTAQFDQALDKLERQGIEGLVIDVRNNPGGLLETAVEMLSRFVENKTVVRMKMKNGREEFAKTFMGSKRRFPYPVVVLVNEDSASAAEIFAGVLRDYKLATLVGEHTYGKASVQNVFMLVDGSSAKITIARYYLPSNTEMSRKVDEEGQYVSGGLVPDVKVPIDVTEMTNLGDPKTDSQLKKALEIIRSKTAYRSN